MLSSLSKRAPSWSSLLYVFVCCRWMSDSYTQMDGELEIPPAWWAEPFTQDPNEMKVGEWLLGAMAVAV